MSVQSIVVWVGLVLAGCTMNPEINSAKAPELQGPLRALFVISEVGSRGELSGEHFQTELERMARRCRIRLGISTVTELDLDPEVHVTRMKSFGARHSLTLNLIGITESTRNFFGKRDPVATRYDARLYEDSKRIVWRATLRLALGAGEEIGSETLAYALMDKLGEDGVIQRCATRAPSTDPGAYAR